MQSSEENIINGSPGTAPSFTGRPSSVPIGETPAAASTSLLSAFEQVGEGSMRSLDTSTIQLRQLMRSMSKVEPDRLVTNPAMVNALCNCAKNIVGLLRLKLDVIRADRHGL